MPPVESASRRVPKATYVPLQVELKDAPQGQAIQKYSLVSQLGLQPGEVSAVQAAAADGRDGGGLKRDDPTWDVLRSFEGSPVASALPPPSAFAAVPSDSLAAFARGVVAVRHATVQAAAAPAAPPIATAPIPPVVGVPAATAPAVARTAAVLAAEPPSLGGTVHAVTLLNAAQVAVNAFAKAVSATPIGMLNLERLEMTPAGIERGDLVATIALAPGERTAVVQKEWSATSSEFTTIVTDSLENVSETGVTENTELAQSTESQTQHSNQFNINASASGGFGFVTASVATSYNDQTQSSQSAKDSRKHSIETTRKASARVKQEHKTTISTTTVSGTSEETTRQIENPSTTDPMRIDYFSMMRKWRVRLYRYGLRMTYDIAIPEPGAAMRRIFADLAEKKAAASDAFSFPLGYGDITETNYEALASQYHAQVPPAPAATLIQTVGGPISGLSGQDDEKFHFSQVQVDVPDGYAIADVSIDYMADNPSNRDWVAVEVLGISGSLDLPLNVPKASRDLTAEFGFMAGMTGQQQITLMVQYTGTAAANFRVTSTLTDAGREAWVAAVYAALYSAAQNEYYARQQLLGAAIADLESAIGDVDTLTLRREESDEIMKGVIRWLLGSAFSFMPDDVNQLFTATGADLAHGAGFTGSALGLDSSQWTTMFQYQEMVKFINEAIEWENMLYFVYPYFWDVPQSWDFIRGLRHPDATRQAFLRAGSARVVLTIRPGYEQSWTSFVELGDFGDLLPPDHPYMTIAQEIRDFDDTNYPGIPPANPQGPDQTDDAAEAGVLLAEWYEYTPSSGTDIGVSSDLGTIA